MAGAMLHHLEILPVSGGHMVRHYMASPGGNITKTREHTFADPEAVANHVEDVLSPSSEEAGEPKMSPRAETREEAAEGDVLRRPTPAAEAARARERRHNELNPMGIGRSAPKRFY